MGGGAGEAEAPLESPPVPSPKRRRRDFLTPRTVAFQEFLTRAKLRGRLTYSDGACEDMTFLLNLVSDAWSTERILRHVWCFRRFNSEAAYHAVRYLIDAADVDAGAVE